MNRINFVAALMIAALPAHASAQTRIDARTQLKNIEVTASAVQDWRVISSNGSMSISCASSCLYRIGERVIAFTGTASISSLSGTGAATTGLIYLSDSGALSFGYNNTIITGASLSGITAAPGVTALPADSFPIASCTISGNQFGACSDQRAIYSRSIIEPGTGVSVIQDPGTGKTTVGVNPSVVAMLGTTNTFSGSNDFSEAATTKPDRQGTVDPPTCAVGEMLFRTDTGVTKRCTSTDTWSPIVRPGAGVRQAGSFLQWDPIDARIWAAVEEFTMEGADSITTSTWFRLNAGTCGASFAAGDYPDDLFGNGVIRFAGGAGTSCGLATSSWQNALAQTEWEVQFFFLLNTATGQNIRLGFADSYGAAAPSNAAAVRFIYGVDGGFVAEIRSSGASVTAPLGVTPTAAAWYRVRMRSVIAGRILFSIATGSGSFSPEIEACASGCALSGTLPSGRMYPVALTAGTGNLYLDRAAAYRVVARQP